MTVLCAKPDTALHRCELSKQKCDVKSQIHIFPSKCQAVRTNIYLHVCVPASVCLALMLKWRGAASANYLIMWHIVISYQASEVFTHRILTPCQPVLTGIAAFPSSTCAAYGDTDALLRGREKPHLCLLRALMCTAGRANCICI